MTATLTAVSSAVWRLDGDVLPGVAPLLRAEGERLLGQAPAAVVIDLGGVSRSTTVALSLLLCWVRAASVAGKSLRFRGMPDSLLDVARLSGLDSVLPLESVPA